MMNWIALISAFGIGAILSKVLDIFWLQRYLRESEKKKWLREERLRVYSNLAKEILSLGKISNIREDPFKAYALTAEATMLVDSEILAKEIEDFFTGLYNLYCESLKSANDPSKRPSEELESAFELITIDSRRIVSELRKSLHE